jgi:hypothetical protein
MSIQKIDFSIVKQEKKTFTTHFNSVLQNLRNPAALGLWAYLSSLPETWIINKAQLRKHFGIGRDKLDDLLHYLEKNDLLETGQLKGKDGKFGDGYIIIKCGYEFRNDCLNTDQNKSYPQSEIPFTENPKCKGIEISSGLAPFTENQEAESPLTDLPYTEKPSHGKTAPINKIQNTNKRKEREALCSFFEPDQANKQLCQSYGLNIDEEVKSFFEKHRGRKDQKEFSIWLKHGYDYRMRNKNVQNEVNSTVPVYGPGHPRWETLHGNGGILNATQGSEVSRDHDRRDGVRKAESYLL